MSETQTAAHISRATNVGDRALLLALIGVFALVPLLPAGPPTWAAATALSLAAGWAALREADEVLRAGLFCTIATLAYNAPFLGGWPVPLVVALAAYAGICALVPRLRGRPAWLRRGTAPPEVRWLVPAAILLSSTALVAWFLVARPDVRDLLATLPKGSPWLLPLAGLAFATVNAFAEEFAYRGILQQALEGVLGSVLWALLLQAVAFGLLHLEGFPRGASGVVLSGVYGLALGIIRWRSRGMLIPWLTHVCADVTIFTILVLLAR